jgi:hypothetical protein
MNRNVISSNLQIRVTDPDSIMNPVNHNFIGDDETSTIINPERIFPVMKWQLQEIFNLFSEAVFVVKNIDFPMSMDIKLMPLSDSLKVQLYNNQNDIAEYFFILNKSDFEAFIVPKEQILLFLRILKVSSDYSFFLERIEWSPVEGGGENPPTNGVRIPNPPPPAAE